MLQDEQQGKYGLDEMWNIQYKVIARLKKDELLALITGAVYNSLVQLIDLKI